MGKALNKMMKMNEMMTKNVMMMMTMMMMIPQPRPEVKKARREAIIESQTYFL